MWLRRYMKDNYAKLWTLIMQNVDDIQAKPVMEMFQKETTFQGLFWMVQIHLIRMVTAAEVGNYYQLGGDPEMADVYKMLINYIFYRYLEFFEKLTMIRFNRKRIRMRDNWGRTFTFYWSLAARDAPETSELAPEIVFPTVGPVVEFGPLPW